LPFLSINGVDCYYESRGSGDPVVILHGGFCSIETMHPQIEALAATFQVWAPERPGHGRSPDRAGEITFRSGVDDTLAFMDAIAVQSAHMVGFSDGAIIGLMLAMAAPDRVRSLVAISGNIDPSGIVAEDRRPAAFPSSAFAELSADYDRLSPDGPEHRDDVLAKLRRLWRDEPRIDPEELGRISAPTLVMAGDHDMISTQHTVAIADAIPHARLHVVPNASHMLMLEQPELVNLAMLDLLGKAQPNHG
jgi:pimeloyl-ACP methyl ester carboxylesterase